MDFFSKWHDAYINQADCSHFIRHFLCKSPESNDALLNGSFDELTAAFSVICNTPISCFIYELRSLQYDRPILTSEILQYSSFSDGVTRIPELLQFYPDGENFINLGYQMVAAPNEAANRKYGENHARLAEALGLATISASKPRYAKLSAWGQYLLQYSLEEKKDLFKKLLLREYYLQTIIVQALNGPVSYFDIVSFLSESTALRRRSNTHHIIDFILIGTNIEDCLNNINWQ
ncbi:MAG: hypothetical protein E7438_04420 [Ruminococcaceae bacterium]|nr:hypothetical protein [Oscillospiraceae bacterium]